MKLKFLSILLCLTTFYSCIKSETDGDIIGGVELYFAPRQCKYVWAHNVEFKQKDGDTRKTYSYISKEGSASINDYVFEFSTCNVNWNYIMQYFDEDFVKACNEGSIDTLASYAYKRIRGRDIEPSDPEIERKLTQIYNPTTRTALLYIEYRTTPIKDLKITSSVNIGDIRAGESLNDLFLIREYPPYQEFIITKNKDVIDAHEKLYDISVSQYLSYHPMAPAALKLKFRDDVSIAEATKATFTIELTTDEGNVLKSETRAVNLLP